MAATRNQDLEAMPARERDYVASVTNAVTGPVIAVPVSHQDHLKVRVYYKTPNGVQYYRAATRSSPRTSTSVAWAVAPTLLPAPTRAERPAPATVGVQVSAAGLLSRWFTRSRQVAPQATEAASQMGVGTVDAYLQWTLSARDGRVIRTGTVLAPVSVNSKTNWTMLDLALDIDLSSEDSRTGTLRLQEVNDGSQAVYFDSLTVTHPQDRALVSQENHYYPFGMALTGVAVNTTAQSQLSKDQFNGGSELQDELLDSQTGIYSTFYRNYDPATGRFQGVDPMADTYADSSPYSFGFNDPVNFNDPQGDDPPQTYAQSVNQMYGEGWYEQFGRGGSNAAFYGNSAFGPAMGTYQPGTSIGPTISSNESYRVAFAAGTNPSYLPSGALSVSLLFVHNYYTDKGVYNSSFSYLSTFQLLGFNYVYNNSNYRDGDSYHQGSGFNIPNAIDELNRGADKVAALNAQLHPDKKVYGLAKCATYVRQALEAGGINTKGHPVPAKDYGPFLIKWGFQVVTSNIISRDYSVMRGDIAVFRGFGTGMTRYGHIEMYNGNQWVSDFKQNFFTPGPPFRNPADPYIIYRWK